MFFAVLVVLMGFSVMSSAQRQRSDEKEEKDSLVSLLNSKSAQMVEIDGISSLFLAKETADLFATIQKNHQIWPF